MIFTVCLLSALNLTPASASSPRVVTQTDHFLIDANCDDASRTWIASRLEAFRDALEVLIPAATGVSLADRTIRIKLFETRAEYLKDTARHAPRLAHNGGFYDGANRTVVAYRRANPLQLQLHEVAHAVLGDVFSDATFTRYGRPGWPVWFEEGFAEYVSSYVLVGPELHFGAVHVARLATLEDALERDRLIPLPRLLRAKGGDFSGQDNSLWYASAWGLVHLMLSEPDLRSRIPEWIGRLRQGEHGLAAFQGIFGQDVRELDRRLRHHIARLSATEARSLDLADGGLDAWTMHEGGKWSAVGEEIHGVGGSGVNYLTRAIAPMGQFTLDLEVKAGPHVHMGIVLGHHAMDRYPYHTLVDLSDRDVVVRHVRDTNHTVPVARSPLHLPAGQWTRIRIVGREDALEVWIGGRQVLRSPLGHHRLSLVGLYVQGGGARFRRLGVAPWSGYAAGIRSFSPPGSP